MCNLANNIVKLERVGDWFEPVLNTRSPLSPITHQFFLFVPPPSTKQPKKIFLDEKNIRGTFALLASPPSYAYELGHDRCFLHPLGFSYSLIIHYMGCAADSVIK